MTPRILVLSLLAAALGAWVAVKKGRNWIVWGLLCFFFPLSFIVLLVMPRVLARGLTKRCPECGRVIPHDAVNCEYCKRELPIEMVQCPRCGKFVPEGQECPDCKS
jgi:RNA polymerase subunit RPABC4/transcription elongation factor Spt4